MNNLTSRLFLLVFLESQLVGCAPDDWSHSSSETDDPRTALLTPEQPTASYSARIEFYSNLLYLAGFGVVFNAFEREDSTPGSALVAIQFDSSSPDVEMEAPYTDNVNAYLSGTYTGCLRDELCIIDIGFTVQLVQGTEAIVNGGGGAGMTGVNYLDLECAMAWMEFDGPFYP